MSILKDESITIYEALQNIEKGKYVMPAFQRQYVWNMSQIEKLWDSILLGYPISTFLFWHVDDENITRDTYFCSFLKECTFNAQKKSVSPNYELSAINTTISDTAVLDGQQRLTSLYLSLFSDDIFIRDRYERGQGGKFTKLLIELDENKIESESTEFNSKKFDIAFTEKIMRISPTQFELRKLISNSDFRDSQKRDNAIEDAIKSVPVSSRDYARNLLSELCVKVFDEKLIRFTEIYGINQDDALEMFVRFNSGGNRLSKAEITMSILEAYWSDSKKEFGKVLQGDFEGYSTDFIIRTALLLFGDVLKSNINAKTASELKRNWEYFKETLKKLASLLSSLNIETSHFATSWNILLPVIFFIYNNPDYEQDKYAIRAYIIRATLFTYFKSGTTSKLVQMRNKIVDECENRITFGLLDNMREFRITDERIEDLLNLEYGSKVAEEILYYLSSEWRDSKLQYNVDHLHPENAFNSKPLSLTMEEWNKCRADRNKLPNLELLDESWNKSRHDKPLFDFYEDSDDTWKIQFKEHAILPENVSLELENFREFFEARKELLKEKIKSMLR